MCSARSTRRAPFVFMSQAKGHHPPSSAHGPSVEPSAVVPSASTTPLVDPAGAAVGVKPDIPLGTCHAPQTSPRSPSNDDLIRYHARPPIKSLLIISGRWPHARPPIGSSSVVAGCASLYIRLKVRHGPRDGNQVIVNQVLVYYSLTRRQPSNRKEEVDSSCCFFFFSRFVSAIQPRSFSSKPKN